MVWAAAAGLGAGPSGTGAAEAQDRPSPAVAPRREITLTIDCAGKSHRINPLVYGIAFDPQRARESSVWDLGPGARRWGGNPSSRYNWQLGNAWNTGKDWFFENVDYAVLPVPAHEHFIGENAAHGVATAVTLPMLGWVAKDTTSHSFPVRVFGAQEKTDPWRPDAGNGVSPGGKPIPAGSPERTSVPAPPEAIARWVSALGEKGRAERGRRVLMYILDNEPMLWNTTHRDVHPEPLSYDGLLERTIAYGVAVRAADPETAIAGPAAWGWLEYFHSARDAAAGFELAPDRRQHGGVPLLPWYLRKLREHRERTGRRILDVVDVHYYPMADGVFSGGVDPATAARRVRATRSLWDPTYVDESWIGESIRLLPRLQEWIDQNDPGLGLSIGEWNFGAPEHVSGGLATAEALGRFGEAGLHSAFYWQFPPRGTPAYHAFRAFRNYDGKGSRFLDWSLRTRAAAPVSLFASRDAEAQMIVAVVLNLDPAQAVPVRIDNSNCGAPGSRRVFSDSGRGQGLAEVSAGRMEDRWRSLALPPWSMNVLEIKLQ